MTGFTNITCSEFKLILGVFSKSLCLLNTSADIKLNSLIQHTRCEKNIYLPASQSGLMLGPLGASLTTNPGAQG
jgi:hypothetical protein